MSSASRGDADGVETPSWQEFAHAWRTSQEVRNLNEVLAQRIDEATEGINNESIEGTAAAHLGHLAADTPRCIHEKNNPGPGYRAEWQHWVADRLQTLKRQGKARFNRTSKLWVGRLAETIRFVPGEVYVRRRIHDRFGGQEQGGISTPVGSPAIFLFTGEEGKEYGYDDGFLDDGSFRYFGEGQYGDMTLTKGNLAVKDHAEDGRDLHLFDSKGNGRVVYIGQMVCAQVEVLPNTKDKAGNSRLGIAFRLVPFDELAEDESVPEATPHEQGSIDEDALWKMSLEELRRIANDPPDTTQGPSKGTRNVYKRSKAVKTYVQRRAKGVCEGCGSPAPFKTPSGRPYLEPHHTRKRSDGGPDKAGWVVAICPTCHRRAHYAVDHHTYNERLKRIANEAEGITE